jgi:heat shock protein HtpX
MEKSKRIVFHDQIAQNKRNSVFLMAGIIVVFVIFGYVIGMAMGPDYFTIIMIVAIVISVLYVWFGYYNSDKLAIASVGAKKADSVRHRDLINSVEAMALASGLPMPRVFVMPGAQINAFASGRDPQHAVIAVTEGALEKLDKQELEGVIAHEMSHINNYDIRFITIATILVGMIAIVSEIFLRSLWFSGGGEKDKNQVIFILIGVVLAILAPIVVYLVQMAISRKREFTADATAVKFIRSPTGLKNALKKIEDDSSHFKKHQISKAVAPLFISNPFSSGLKGLTSTHPPLEKRIEVLERM